MGRVVPPRSPAPLRTLEWATPMTTPKRTVPKNRYTLRYAPGGDGILIESVEYGYLFLSPEEALHALVWLAREHETLVGMAKARKGETL